MVLLRAAVVFFLLFLVFLVMSGLVLRVLRRGARLGAPGPAKKPQPRRIHLTRTDEAALRDPAIVEALSAPLRALGYEDAGLWKIEELGLSVRFLLDRKDAVYAIAYDRHAALGSWLDLVTLYADGGSITANNLARPAALDERPGHARLRVP